MEIETLLLSAAFFVLQLILGAWAVFARWRAVGNAQRDFAELMDSPREQ